jgi:ADP-ribosylglycohydrolase
MTNNEQKILDLIREYVQDVQYFTKLMNKQNENGKGFHVYKPTGYFDKEETLYYSFHGVGIYLSSPDKKVDFDFYTNRRTDTFHPWFILNYIQSNPKFKDNFGHFNDKDEIHNILKRLVSLGFLTKMQSKYKTDYFALKGVKPVFSETYSLTDEEWEAFYVSKTREMRKNWALKSLKGVSIGDAFGESFFGDTDTVNNCIQNKIIPSTTWEFTDDTVMSIAIFEQLEKYEDINQDDLILQFCQKHDLDVNRGYGATLRRILREVSEGGDWKYISKNAFDGMGSMGNGAAMRASSIGAYYFDDLEKIKSISIKSAEVTHSNIEGICGAIAVAIATAIAVQYRIESVKFTSSEFIKKVVKELPESDTKSKINKSISIPYSYSIETVRGILGNGVNMTSQDTVPFAIWCAAHNLDNFENSLWEAVSILGDRDTICAIVGGITMISSDGSTIPKEWLDLVEDFENSIFRNK